jgi:hypothetical protein
MRLRELPTGRTGPARGRQCKGSPHWRPRKPAGALGRVAVYGISPLGAPRRRGHDPRCRGVRRPGAARCRRVARQPAGQRAVQRRRPMEAATTDTRPTRRLSAEPWARLGKVTPLVRAPPSSNPIRRTGAAARSRRGVSRVSLPGRRLGARRPGLDRPAVRAGERLPLAARASPLLPENR